MKKHSLLLLFGMTLALASPSYADQKVKTPDPLIEGAKLCTRHLPRYEREFGIPTHLLSAIASTESGRFHTGLKLNLPWPWTINVEGKGYFFNSKQDAIKAVKKFRAHGAQSIDVGCMQVNLSQHPRAFSSLDQAFEPQTNIAYAASFLHDLYEEQHSWRQAAAFYHSRTPKLGTQYVGLVYNSWYQIIDKLRAARLQVPESTVLAMNDMHGKPRAQTRITRLSEQAGRNVPAYKTPRSNIIEISKKEATQEHSAIVVPAVTTVPETTQAQADLTPITVAQAKPQAAPETSLKIIRPDDTQLPALTPSSGDQKNGPRFIFSD